MAELEQLYEKSFSVSSSNLHGQCVKFFDGTLLEDKILVNVTYFRLEKRDCIMRSRYTANMRIDDLNPKVL